MGTSFEGHLSRYAVPLQSKLGNNEPLVILTLVYNRRQRLLSCSVIAHCIRLLCSQVALSLVLNAFVQPKFQKIALWVRIVLGMGCELLIILLPRYIKCQHSPYLLPYLPINLLHYPRQLKTWKTSKSKLCAS